MEKSKVNLSVVLEDATKLSLLLELLRHLDFVRVEDVTPIAETDPPASSDFHKLAGIWADRDIDANELRRQAWGGRGV